MHVYMKCLVRIHYSSIFSHLDLNELNGSFCFESGIHLSLLIRNGSVSPRSTDLLFPEVSIIPPYQKEGCFFNLYYNGSILEETFYVYKEGPALSKRKKWKILRSSLGYSKDHYEIFHSIFNGKY